MRPTNYDSTLDCRGTCKRAESSETLAVDSEAETHSQRRQPGNRLVAHFHYSRLVGRGIVLELRFKRTGVLAVQQVDDLGIELPAAGGPARAPADAHIGASKDR